MAGQTGDIARQAQATLAASQIFGVLEPSALAQLVAAGALVNLAPGEALFLQGDEGDAAFIVLEGELEVRTLSKEGRELRIAAYRAGGLIGEMATLDGAPRSADVVACRRTAVWRLPRSAVLETLEANARASIALVVELTRRLRTANAALELASRRDLEAQLAVLLLGQQNRLGYVGLSQTEIARRIGFSREKVNRKLHAWVERDWIAIERKGVQVKLASALRTLAA